MREFYGQKNIRDNAKLGTLYGGYLVFDESDNGDIAIRSEGAREERADIIDADIKAKNGLIHAIDGVLKPAFMARNTLEVLESMGWFSKLIDKVQSSNSTDILDWLTGPNPVTIFAPTNEAFQYAWKLLDKIEEEDEDDGGNRLETLLKYHIFNDEVLFSDEVTTGTDISSEGENIVFTKFVDSGKIIINNGYDKVDARVTKDDILTCNGVIHVIDRVLIPPSFQPEEPSIADFVKSKPALSILEEKLSDAGLLETLDGGASPSYTLFAPLDSAFNKLGDNVPTGDALKVLLEYHLLDTGKLISTFEDSVIVTLNGCFLWVDVFANNRKLVLNDMSTTVDTDIEKRNGVVHVVDKVFSSTSCIDVLEDLRLHRLLYAIDKADEDEDSSIRETLEDVSQKFTVFAPTNEAFKKIKNLANMADAANTTAASILLNHVTSASGSPLLNSALPDGKTLSMAGGESLTVAETETTLKNSLGGDYTVTTKFLLTSTCAIRIKDVDFQASNCAVHVIDDILLFEKPEYYGKKYGFYGEYAYEYYDDIGNDDY